MSASFECENCLGMMQHGCYCAAIGASQPGGPRDAAPEDSAERRLARLHHDLCEIHELLSKAISDQGQFHGQYVLPWSVISWSRDAAGRGSETIDDIVGPVCQNCTGRGIVDNPDARYEMDRDTGNYETNDAEEIDCPSCYGTGLAPTPTPGGDGCYCTHHPDDPAHGDHCYAPASREEEIAF